jgi:hypothetical protein
VGELNYFIEVLLLVFFLLISGITVVLVLFLSTSCILIILSNGEGSKGANPLSCSARSWVVDGT